MLRHDATGGLVFVRSYVSQSENGCGHDVSERDGIGKTEAA